MRWNMQIFMVSPTARCCIAHPPYHPCFYNAHLLPIKRHCIRPLPAMLPCAVWSWARVTRTHRGGAMLRPGEYADVLRVIGWTLDQRIDAREAIRVEIVVRGDSIAVTWQSTVYCAQAALSGVPGQSERSLDVGS